MILLASLILLALASVFAVEVAILVAFRRHELDQSEQAGETTARITSLEGRADDHTAAIGKLASAVDGLGHAHRTTRTG
jgi:hypothetical protein